MLCLLLTQSPMETYKNIPNKPNPPVWKLKAEILSSTCQPDTGNEFQPALETLCPACHTRSCHPAPWHEHQGCGKNLHLLPALQDPVSSTHTLLSFHPLIPVPLLLAASSPSPKWGNIGISLWGWPNSLSHLPEEAAPIPWSHPQMSLWSESLYSYNYTQISNSSSLLPMLGTINHVQDTLAWSETFLNEKTELKEMDSSITNNPDMAPTARYPTHSLWDPTPVQFTAQRKNPILSYKSTRAPQSTSLPLWRWHSASERMVWNCSPITQHICLQSRAVLSTVFRHHSCFSLVPEYSSMPFTQGDREPSASLLLLVATCSFPSPHMAAWAGPDSLDKAGLQHQETPNASVTPRVSPTTHKNAVKVMTRNGSALIKCICSITGTFRGWAMRVGSEASWVCVKNGEERSEVAEKGIPKAWWRSWDRQESSVGASVGHQTTHLFIEEAKREALRLKSPSAGQRESLRNFFLLGRIPKVFLNGRAGSRATPVKFWKAQSAQGQYLRNRDTASNPKVAGKHERLFKSLAEFYTSCSVKG